METKKTFKLPKESTERWLEALRNGKYEQAQDTLVLTDTIGHDREVMPIGYCCLGVALCLSGVPWEDMIGQGEPDELLENGDLSVLPDDYPLKGLGIYPKTILMSLNDGFSLDKMSDWLSLYPDLKFKRQPDPKKGEIIRYSFSEIADFIEENAELA